MIGRDGTKLTALEGRPNQIELHHCRSATLLGYAEHKIHQLGYMLR
jgi:hypothetical protein